MNTAILFQEILDGKPDSLDDWKKIYSEIPTADLMFAAHALRLKKHPENLVTWIIDRNINITNVCVSRCSFCNFHCTISSQNAYITSWDEYKTKIAELFQLGGRQVLLQGGMHPKLGLPFYIELFKQLKQEFPLIKLHALGPPEIVHLAKLEQCSYKQILQELMKAGLDSLPGAGAEILSDRVRKIISPAKCSTHEWLEVMHTAHTLNLLTTATMMFGHIETPEERLEHLFAIRELQNQKPKSSTGFISFIPWPFQDKETQLSKKFGITNTITANDYIRLIAISRLILNNISNIQASWLTVGIKTAQTCLYAGANDLGSIMIEEKVVSSAGANFRLSKEEMKTAITEAGFTPALRNQQFELLSI